MLFTNLPFKLFEPLASPNRKLYERSLLTLFHEFYSTTRSAPSKDEVINSIGSILQSEPDMWQNEEDEETETDVKKLHRGRARDICDRLTECGWLEAHKSGYRVILEFSPAALHLMQSLWKIDNGSVERLDGVMQTLKFLVDNLKGGNISLTSALSECAKHLGDIRISMRNTRTKIMRTRSEMFKIRSRSERLAHLMKWYVGGVFIQDIGSIMSDRHPWILRSKTINVIEEFMNDESKMMSIGDGYAYDNFRNEMLDCSAIERAEFQNKGLKLAYDDFNNIKEEISAIEELAKSITSLQARLNDILVIQGTASIAHGSTNTEKLEEVMVKFAHYIGRNQSANKEEPMPALVSEKTLHLSENALRNPSIRRKPKATVLVEEPVSPISLFRDKLVSIYQDRIYASDERVMSFIDELIGTQDTFSFDENSLATIDDFIAASAIVKMAISGDIPPVIEKAYAITCDDEFDLVDTEYMSCPKIIICKRQESRHAA